MKKRVLLAGLYHESHSFLDGVTPLSDFQLRSGSEGTAKERSLAGKELDPGVNLPQGSIFQAEGDGSPMAGVLAIAKARNWELIPALDLRAMPSPVVADDVFEFFWQKFKQTAQGSSFDGIYLVLHGAMCCQSIPDVEGELLERIRSIPSCRNVPLCGVLDLHANFSAKMTAHSNGLIAYRENPHTDAFETAQRAAELLDRLMQSGERPVTVWERPPLIWTPQGTATASDPMKSLKAEARNIERTYPGVLAVNVLAGFAYADTPDTGVSFSAITNGDPEQARDALRKLSAMALEMKDLGLPATLSPADCMAAVKRHESGPIVIAEPSDNIGGGAPGDSTGLLLAFIDHEISNAAVAIWDPQAVTAAARAGIGSKLRLNVGGKGSRLDAGPLSLDVEVTHRSDGNFELEDRQSHLASMSGQRIEMGPCVVVKFKGLRILLTSRRTPPFDLGQFRSQGIIPESLFAIGVKAAAAHRRAYDKIALAHYSIDTPGPCASNLKSLPYRNVKRPVYPLK